MWEGYLPYHSENKEELFIGHVAGTADLRHRLALTASKTIAQHFLSFILGFQFDLNGRELPIIKVSRTRTMTRSMIRTVTIEGYGYR